MGAILNRLSHPISDAVEKLLARNQVDGGAIRDRAGKARSRHIPR